MIVNYHTHTWRCRHALGNDEEYVQAALAAGLEALGFSDHTPYWFPGEYYSSFRMFPEQLDEYAQSVRALQQLYAGQIDLSLGVEAEFYPALFGTLLSHLRDAGVEYMLLGQHFVGNEIQEPYSGHPTDDPAILKQYCRQVRDAMQTGLFTYVAHPDLIHFIGDPAVYRQEITGLCKDAKDCGVPLELNLLGLAGDRHYPRQLFWELAGTAGNSVVIGRDAHAPRHFADTATEEKALAMVQRFGLHLLTRPQLKNI